MLADTDKLTPEREPSAINQLLSANFKTMPEFPNNTEVKAQQASEISLGSEFPCRSRLSPAAQTRQRRDESPIITGGGGEERVEIGTCG